MPARFDQPLELERLRAVREGQPSAPLPTIILSPLVAPAIRTALLEDRDHAELAAGVLGVVVVHVGLGVADEGRIVGEPLAHHRVELLLRQAVAVLDDVAAGRDRVLQPLAAEAVAGRLTAQAMRLVHERLQHRQRIGEHVLRFARRA